MSRHTDHAAAALALTGIAFWIILVVLGLRLLDVEWMFGI